MSQHDFNIANQLFPATRADLNNAFVALASNSSGDAEPGTTYANQWWYETDTNTLKLRNEANSAWIEIATLDQSSNNVLSITTQGLTLGATAITATATEINILDALTRGSLIYGNPSGVTSELVKGGAGTVLTSDGTDISWAAGGGGGMEFIASSGAISNAASVAFTQFDASKYDDYQFMFHAVIPATDGVELYCQTSTDGGGNYATTNGDYHSSGNVDRIGICVSRAYDVGSDTNEYGVSGIFYLFAPHLATYTTGISVATTFSSSPAGIYATGSEASARVAAEDTDAVRFIFNSGNIESGEITMFGIVNS